MASGTGVPKVPWQLGKGPMSAGEGPQHADQAVSAAGEKGWNRAFPWEEMTPPPREHMREISLEKRAAGSILEVS